MLNGHRDQIAKSESGLAGSVLARHSKVKQSIGDSTKLAMLATQMLKNPEPSPIQQGSRGRPPKPKDTTTVPTAMMDTASKLAPPETIA